uniref:Cytochrome c biogenesis protein Ccs1 n=1 Tax=Liagora brachyclada TaxID=1884665 RepID=A0A1G4NZK6_9FLOR|nr:Cytochrome c biogenesis protein ccs1 [Liagora brachyclada]SCW24110.1 Cytochrome c biogenesis protein ccs1 [Liagora brachyclada]
MTYKIVKWKVFRLLGNLNFSITLLLIIASTSVLGTIIEQNQSIDYYKLKYPMDQVNFMGLNWLTITRYHLDELYTSFPFLSLTILFSLSLLICTFSTQLPSLRNARQWKMKAEIRKDNNMSNILSFDNHSFCIPLYTLAKRQYYTFYQEKTIYAYKGLYGRIAPIIVHFSIITLLTGALGSLFSSFYIQAMVPKGESFSLHNITNSGIFSKIPDNITGKVHNFDIEYYPNSSIKQFRSSIEIYNQNNNKKLLQTIEVNKPLKFENLTVYQTDWKINGLRLQIDNKIIQVPVTEINDNKQYWFTSIKYANNRRISMVISNLQDNILCYDQNGDLIKSITLNQADEIDHIPIRVIEILTSTGLQIKADYGLTLVYASFGLLMLSIIISYLSFSQIWIANKQYIIRISGKTNRAQLNLEEDLLYIYKYLQNKK